LGLCQVGLLAQTDSLEYYIDGGIIKFNLRKLIKPVQFRAI
jgi:hypothetical protein